ncbi:Anthranilate synthase, aminase component [hydrothermal vent metagenome]|uniref:Anthranilate synthase component 1 n=1 Tax=hydrothermal vent metagenome TaxID=652676 RepID=A0A3B0S3Q0_9ZZZZ
MAILPDFSAFTRIYDQGAPQAVYTSLVADLETPVTAMLKISKDANYSFLLESVEGGAVRGRYSMIGLNPDLIMRINGPLAEVNRTALEDEKSGFEKMPQKPLDALRAVMAETMIELPDALPPMAAGLFGYMGYDMVRLMENLPQQNIDVLQVPDGIFIRPTVMAIFDAVKDEVTVVAPIYPSEKVSARVAYEKACNRLDAVVNMLEQPLDPRVHKSPDAPAIKAPASNVSPDEYKDMVLKIKDYIKAGDVFQTVISQRFETEFPLPPFALYRALRRVNPSPFLYFLNFDDFSIIGSSPEILVRVREGRVSIRPIAGTRPRGATPTADKALADELLADPKELAEHLMLLDLGRNDVGRVAEIGSVEVTDQFILEFYSQVMHIVSNVEGNLDKKFDAIDALEAGFPAGTVSGAPKVRAMEIIDELEKEKRGPYAGCVGYFSANGDMDTCIVLRTAIVKDGKMYVQAGAGVVADSVPQSEHEECINKAKALFRAAEEAVRFAGQAGRGQ